MRRRSDATKKARTDPNWDPPSGMVKKRCSRCCHWFAVPVAEMETTARCPDCVDLRRALVARRQAGETITAIAAAYGMSRGTVANLITEPGDGTGRPRGGRTGLTPASPEMVARRLAGETLASIAADYGRTSERIRQLLVAAGLKSARPVRPPWSAARDEELRAPWIEGLPVHLIAARLGTTKYAAAGRARRLGLRRPKPEPKPPRSPKPVAARNCALCGVRFVPQRNRGLYCSKRCCGRASRQRRVALPEGC